MDNATGNDAKIQTGQRTAPCQLTANVLLYRHSTDMQEQIVIARKDGELATFTAIPMHIIDPYSNGLNAQRTIWVAVNNNHNLSTTGNGEEVFRNTAAGMMKLFLTRMIDGKQNPYNALLVEDAEIRTALLPRIDKGNAKSKAMHESFMKVVENIRKTVEDEHEANMQIKEQYKKYQVFRNALHEKGDLEVSQLLLSDNIMPIFAPSPLMNSGNPFLDFKSMAKKFNFTYSPRFNSVSGLIQTNMNQPPKDSGIELGRRAIDKSATSARHAASTMATVKDALGNTTEIVATVLDLPYTQANRKNPEATRSAIFENVSATPTTLFVKGILKPLVYEAGVQAGTNGHSLFNIEIEEYLQQNILNNGVELNATSLEAAIGDFDFNQDLSEIVTEIVVQPKIESKESENDSYETPI